MTCPQAVGLTEEELKMALGLVGPEVIGEYNALRVSC